MKLPLQRLIFASFVFLGLNASVHSAPDLVNGKNIDQQKCYACHAKKSGFGNGDMIYTRTDGKVKNFQGLKSMVAICNTELRLDLFPEDEVDVAAFLNQQFYKFQ